MPRGKMKTMMGLIEPPILSYKLEDIADWIELYIILNRTTLCKADVGQKVEADSGHELSSADLDDVWIELTRRMRLYGVNPPFILGPRTITPSRNGLGNSPYLMFLLLSYAGNSNENYKGHKVLTSTDGGRIFEEICALAIKKYMGGMIEVHGRRFKGKKLNVIAPIMNEKIGNGYSTLNNDGGVDLIAWKPFGDARPSQICVLFQCAAGKDYADKFGDIVLDLWCDYLKWAAFPLRGFTTASVFENDQAEFIRTSRQAGVLLDRPRLYANLIGVGIGQKLRREILSWCNKKIMIRCN